MNATPKILMVDDEPNVLAGYRRTLGRRFAMDIAEGGAVALGMMQTSGPYDVVVTDMRMPLMDGIQFVQIARQKHRESVYIMLTGNADQDTAVRAINEGQLFRFLNKPCSSEQLEQALTAGLRQHELITAERVLLRDTLTGSIRVLMDILELSNPALARMQKAIRQTARDIAASLGFESGFDFDLSSSISLLGFAALDVRGNLDAVGEDMLDNCAASGGRLLGHIPRLEHVAGILSRQRSQTHLTDSIDSIDPIDREHNAAQIIRLAVDFHREMISLPNGHAVLKKLRSIPGRYDSRLILAMEQLDIVKPMPRPGVNAWTACRLPVESLEAGMVLSEDLLSTDKKLLLGKDHELTSVAIERLHSLVRRGILKDDIGVLVKSEAHAAAA